VEQSSPRIGHVDTLSVVRDLDVLRAALGEERLSFLGASYGTFIGAWYAETFPWRVGRIVLDGAVDPSVDLAGYVSGQAKGFDRGLTDYLAWCLGRDDCPFRGTPAQARDQLGSLVDKADGAPLETGDSSRPLTQSLMFTGIAQGLYSDALWKGLNKALADALTGDGGALLELADRYNDRSSSGVYGEVLEANPAIYCLDHGETRSAEEIGAAADVLAQQYPPLGGFIGWGALGCAEWPLPAVVHPTRLVAEGADPILVVGTVGDPATPYEWAQSLAGQLSSGRLLTWEGAGHTAYGRGGKCIDDAVEAFLIAGTLPAEGTRCPA
jgi:pimeloyl-ACP methyl ester carboxylesterase